jgi:hypothetical protein
MALLRVLDQSRSDIYSAPRYFEEQRLRGERTIVAQGRYLGAYMEARIRSEAERRHAETTRIPERVRVDLAVPFDYEAVSLRP